MAKTTMVAADVLQGRRAMRLEVIQPTEAVQTDERLLSVFEAVERQLAEIRERVISIDRRLDTVQAALASRPRSDGSAHSDAPPEEEQAERPQALEFLVYVWSPGASRLESVTGILPAPGDVIGQTGIGQAATGHAGEAIVLTIGASPLVADARPCVFALPAPA